MDEEILVEWNPWWTKDDFSIEYVDRDIRKKLENWLNRREIIPITGCRRAGKTTLMYMTIQSLLEKKIDSRNILFVKCDDERVEEKNLIENAREKHKEMFNPDGRIYLFLDEIQEIEDWDKTIKRIYDLEQRTKIFLSGSRLLKTELSSALAGRFIYFDVYPFFFTEFLRAKGINWTKRVDLLSKKTRIKHHLREYLQWGGFPEIVLENEENKKRKLLRFYSDSILYRDVIQRSGINKPEKVEKLKNYLLSNFTNLLNYSRIASHLGVSSDTISSYIHHMEESYFFFPLPMFSYSLKKQQFNPKKIYCIDNGIRNSVGFKFNDDLGRLYENSVFLELKRRYDEIYYWNDRNMEVDFLVKEKDKIKELIQVCCDVSNTDGREEKSLIYTLKKFNLQKGTIITGDTREKVEIDDLEIIYIPLWEWLLI
ncbi:MAG: ATP-binding protein [Candidatus Thermoplasmatota archaeon]